ncbi:MAG TPA: RHS repeat-associated core domain-containing protein [Candidatus Acidoferrales bacterium]|nr:RHS repeat-associated core domain-containing protein [Candidatus Acidoferrales bacterium]
MRTDPLAGRLDRGARANLVGRSSGHDARGRGLPKTIASASAPRQCMPPGWPANRISPKAVANASRPRRYDGVNPIQDPSRTTVNANLLAGPRVDEYLTRTDGLGTANLLVGPLGSTVALADPTGTVQTSYTYDPFGVTTVQGASNGNSYEFTGRENDGDGLYFLRARYYSPGLERFTKQDPVQFDSGDWNLYAYSRNSPTLYRDPTGRFPIYGNWCGPNWTGGRVGTYHPELAFLYAPPIDAVDEVCEHHDICYWSCRNQHPCDPTGRSKCFATCDQLFLEEMPWSPTIYGTIALGLDAAIQTHEWYGPDPEQNAPSCRGCSGGAPPPVPH